MAGNYGLEFDDNDTVDCETCRESLSARIDGESEVAPTDRTDEHLRGCGACQTWHRRAVELRRSLLVRPAALVPDLSQAILANAPRHTSRSWGARGALIGVAACQIALGLSQLVGVGGAAAHGHDGATVASHLFNESTAWNLALGLGMFWAAFRPRATAGMIPVLAGFVVVLFAFSTYDLIIGAAPVPRVVGHGLLIAGLCLLVVVNRQQGNPTPDDADRTGAGIGAFVGARPVAEPAVPDEVTRQNDRPNLRPAGRRRAA
jgi:predicted anti-sigma-YlaC factor YlaD